MIGDRAHVVRGRGGRLVSAPAGAAAAGLVMTVAVAGLVLLVAADGAPALAPARPDGPAPPARKEAKAWRALEPGLDLGEFPSPRPSDRGDSIVRLLRVDPARFDLRLMNASASGQGRPLTAKAWCARAGLVAAINASMYQIDHRTSVSLMKTGTHTNNSRLSKDRAILAFDRLDASVPPVTIIDRDCDDFEALRGRYGTLVQSIRMISCKGRNVWSPQPRRWSTAAIGRDAQGRVLFVHVRSPYSTHDLIDILMALPAGIERALYVEGGPEAQLYVTSGGREYEWVGSYESGFNEDDDNHAAWPVPNVIGIVRRAPPPKGPAR